MTPRKPISNDAALARLESLCARAEHCSFELLAKLRNWGIKPDDADRIINHLIDNKFVDDLRFTQAFVRDRYRFSAFGRRKIILALRAKRIPSDTIDTALQEIDPDIYFDNLLLLVRRKAANLDLTTFDDRNKLYRYALSRGYESDIAVRAIKTCIADQRL